MDNSVEIFVDNSGLWITRELSTVFPQDSEVYPQFYPQLSCRVLGVAKGNPTGYPHIHKPYYYYYSNRLMV